MFWALPWAGHPYGVLVKVKDGAEKEYTNTYYGRGYVQLTWKANYEKMGQALNLKDTLVIHPEKALSPETALRDYVVWHAQRLFHWS